MSPIKDFSLTYQALNEEGTFSEGDILRGTVYLTLTKDTKVKSIFVKVVGDARVKWTEGSGDSESTYSAHRRYFKVKQYLIDEKAKGNVLPQGTHQFKFGLEIPSGPMPSSFKGRDGKIVYMLKAKMSRSWKWPSKIENEIPFVSNSLRLFGQAAVCPQYGSTNKEMGIFSKKEVHMSASVNRKVVSPGDTLTIDARVSNSSSKKMRLKYSLQQKTVYKASRNTKTAVENLCKMVGDTIGPNSEESVACDMKIPADAIHTLLNCDIVSVYYELKVYLDISFAFDPEVVFPVIIIPRSFVRHQPVEAEGTYTAGAAAGPSYSGFPPPHNKWMQ